MQRKITKRRNPSSEDPVNAVIVSKPELDLTGTEIKKTSSLDKAVSKSMELQPTN